MMYFLSRGGALAAAAGYAWHYGDAWRENWPVAASLAGGVLLLFLWSARLASRHRCPVCREGVLRATGGLHPHARKWLGLSAAAPAAWDVLTADNHQCMHCHSRCRNQRAARRGGPPAPGFTVTPWNPLTGGSVFDPAPVAPRAAFIAPGAPFAEVPDAVPPPASRHAPFAAHAERNTPPPRSVPGDWEVLPVPPLTEPVWTKESFWENPSVPVPADTAAPPAAAPPPVVTPATAPQGPNPFLPPLREPAKPKPEPDAPFLNTPPPAPAAPPPGFPSVPVTAPTELPVSVAAPAPSPSPVSMEIHPFPPPPMPVPPSPAAAATAVLPPPESPAATPAPEMLRDLLDVMRDGRRALDSAFDQILVRLQGVLGEAPGTVAAPATVAAAPPAPPLPGPPPGTAAVSRVTEWTAPPKPPVFADSPAPPPGAFFPTTFPVLEGKTAPFPAPIASAPAPTPVQAPVSLPPAALPAAPPVLEPVAQSPLAPLLPPRPPAPEPVRPVAAPAAPANWFPVHSIAPAPAPAPLPPAPAPASMPASALSPLPPLTPPPAPQSPPLPFPPALPGVNDWSPADTFFAPASSSALPPTPVSPSQRPRRLPALDPLTAQELSHTLANAFTPPPPAAPPAPQPATPPAAESPFQFLGSPLTEEPWPDLPDSPWNHHRGRSPQS